MAKWTLDQLVELPLSELDHRMSGVLARTETRSARCETEQRDMTDREAQLTEQDKSELELLQQAIVCREQIDTRSQQVQDALDRTPRPETRGRLAEFTDAIAAGRPARVNVECRSITTANAGARTATAVESLGRPQWLWQASGIPFTVANSLKVQGPLWDALVAQTATAEGGTKPAMGDPALAEATLRAFAVVQTASDQVLRFGIGPAAVTDRLTAESVFSVNAAAADAIEVAAGTPLVYTTSASHMADRAIAKVWAQTGAKPTALLVNSADYPLLSDKAAVGPGDTVGAQVVMFNGVPFVVNDAVTAGVAVAFNGRTMSAHGTDVLLASLPDLDNNTVKLRAETYFALLAHDAGAIVAVEVVEDA